MIVVSAARSAALLILQQTPSPTTAAAPRTVAETQRDDGGRNAGPRAQAMISDALFSVTRTNSTKLLVNLLERAGQVFGLDRKDFDTLAAFGAAIGKAVLELKADPGRPGPINNIAARLGWDAETVEILKDQTSPIMIIGLIEKALGLDKLGVTLDQLVRAAVDPEGSDATAVQEALAKRSGEVAATKNAPAQEDSRAPMRVQLGEAGLYNLSP